VIRTLPFLIELALVIFCVIDVIQTPVIEIRNLPKWVGGGSPASGPSRPVAAGCRFPETERPRQSTADIDARLEQDLARLDREHEEALRKWERDLEERERKLRGESEG
jgi:hypothetical protein